MNPKVLALLDDESFWQNVVDRALQQKKDDDAARALFASSPTFQRMLAAFTETTTPVSFDNEELAYFPERVLERVWGGKVTVDDAQRFIDVMAHPLLDDVPQEARQSDPGCDFSNERYLFKGLIVSTMSGQGTVVNVENQAAVEAFQRQT